MSSAAVLQAGLGPMPPKVERRLREVAYEHTGIQLGPEKASLLAARVQKRMRALNIPDYRAYLEHFESHPEELQGFINAITTNTTSFWREPDHFDTLRQHLEARVAAGQRRHRWWCAASSTGQEPYNMALIAAPIVEEHGLDLQILATDIDTQVLGKAHRALYPSDAIDPLPVPLRAAFEVVPGGMVRVVEKVRRLVKFAKLNLTRPPFPMRGPIDVVFCRNVMIYLDTDARRRMVEEFERVLAPGGLVCIGHSESIVGMTRKLKIDRPSVYTVRAS